jgi:hypothetical protein
MDGTFFHTKCEYHILNLIVKAGMEVDPIQNLIGKYKDALRYVDSSIRKKQYFAELWYSLEPMKVKFLKYWREIPPSPSLVTVPVRHGKTRLARLRHIDTTRLVTVPIRHNTNKVRHSRHGVPYPCCASFYHFWVRHDTKKIK